MMFFVFVPFKLPEIAHKSPAIAHRSYKQEADQSKSFFPTQLDMSAPASAAISILGVATSDVKQDVNLQDLTTGIINSFDKNGHLQQGFGFTTSFKKLGFNQIGANEGYHSYFNDASRRLSWGTTLSAAAIKGSSTDDPSGRIAVALSFPIIDKTDWRANDSAVKQYSDVFVTTIAKIQVLNSLTLKLRDFQQGRNNITESYFRKEFPIHVAAMRVALASKQEQSTDEAMAVKKSMSDAIEAMNAFLALSPGDAGVAGSIAKAVELNDAVTGNWSSVVSALTGADVKAATEKFVSDSNDKFWNGTKFDISVANSWFAADASKDSFKNDGFYAWAAYSAALNKDAKYTLFGRMATKDRSFDTTAKTWNIGNSRAVGAGVHMKDGAFLEYMSTSLDMSGTKKNEVIWQGGYELKMTNGQWLQIAIGKGSGGGTSRNILGINWSFNLGSTSNLKAKRDTKPQ